MRCVSCAWCGFQLRGSTTAMHARCENQSRWQTGLVLQCDKLCKHDRNAQPNPPMLVLASPVAARAVTARPTAPSLSPNPACATSGRSPGCMPRMPPGARALRALARVLLLVAAGSGVRSRLVPQPCHSTQSKGHVLQHAARSHYQAKAKADAQWHVCSGSARLLALALVAAGMRGCCCSAMPT